MSKIHCTEVQMGEIIAVGASLESKVGKAQSESFKEWALAFSLKLWNAYDGAWLTDDIYKADVNRIMKGIEESANWKPESKRARKSEMLQCVYGYPFLGDVAKLWYDDSKLGNVTRPVLLAIAREGQTHNTVKATFTAAKKRVANSKQASSGSNKGAKNAMKPEQRVGMAIGIIKNIKCKKANVVAFQAAVKKAAEDNGFTW